MLVFITLLYKLELCKIYSSKGKRELSFSLFEALASDLFTWRTWGNVFNSNLNNRLVLFKITGIIQNTKVDKSYDFLPKAKHIKNIISFSLHSPSTRYKSSTKSGFGNYFCSRQVFVQFHSPLEPFYSCECASKIITC